MADFVAEVGHFGCEVPASVFLNRLLIALLYGAGSLTDCADIMHWLRETCVNGWWRSNDQKVLGDRCQRELELGTVRAA